MIRIALFAVAGLVLLAVAAIALAPMAIPPGALATRLEAALEEALGREARVAPDLRIATLPTARIRTGEIVIANPAGFDGPHFARIASADLGVRLLPLLARRVEITSFVLEGADIRLQVAADGRPNWAFEGAAAPAPASAESPAPGGEGAGRPAPSGGPALGDLVLGDVRLAGASVSFRDLATGASYDASNIDAAATLRSLDQPMEARVTASVNGAPARFEGRIAPVRPLLEGGSTAISGDARLGGARAEGSADVVLDGGGVSASGSLDARIDDVRALAALFSGAIDAPGPFGAAALSGAFSAEGASFSFRDAAFRLDDIAGEGEVGLDFSNDRPSVRLVARMEDLDLRPYLAAPGSDGAPSEPDRRSGGSARGDDGAPAGWSEEPIDVSVLSAADVAFDLATGAILIDGLSIDESALKGTIRNGVLEARLETLALYEGTGSARLGVDARGRAPKISVKAGLQGLNAAAFAAEALDLDAIEGRASFDIDMTATGASEKALVSSLEGAGSFQVADGALLGVDMGAAAEQAAGVMDRTALEAASGLLSAAGEAKRTPFSALSATFAATGGVLAVSDIAMASERVSMTGAGTIDLPRRTSDLKLRAAYTKSGTGASRSVPLFVGGPFENPRFGVDLERAAGDVARNEIDQVIDRAIGGALKRGDDDKAGAIAGAAKLLGLGKKREEPAKTEEPAEEPPAEETPSEDPPAEDGAGDGGR